MGKSGFSIRAKMLDTHLRASFIAYLFGFRTLTQGTYIKVIPESSGWKFERSFRGLKLSFVGLRPSLIAKWWEVCPQNIPKCSSYINIPSTSIQGCRGLSRGKCRKPLWKRCSIHFSSAPALSSCPTILIWVTLCHHQSRWSPFGYEGFVVVCNTNIEVEPYNIHCGIMRFAHVQENAEMVLLLVPLQYSCYKRPWKHQPSRWNFETRNKGKH